MNIRTYVLIALVAALVVVMGMLLLPLMRVVPIPVMKVIWVAPLYSLGLYVLLAKKSIRGISGLFGLVIGFLLSMFMPYIFLVSVLGGFSAELAGFVAWKVGLNETRANEIRAVVFPGAQLPLMYVLIMPLDTANSWYLMLALTIAVVLTACLGTILAKLVVRRLRLNNS